MPATRWLRLCLIVGLVLMIAGAIDPLEGSIVILVGSGLVALAAFLAKSHTLPFFVASFILVVIGVVAMFSLSAYGGIGGDTGRPIAWGIIILPYPIGWVMGIVGAIRWILDSRRRHAAPLTR